MLGKKVTLSVSRCISAAAGATCPTNGYLAGFAGVVINWLHRPTTFQNLLLQHLCKRVRIYPATQATSWTTVGHRGFTKRILFLNEIYSSCTLKKLNVESEPQLCVFVCYCRNSKPMSSIPIGCQYAGQGNPFLLSIVYAQAV